MEILRHVTFRFPSTRTPIMIVAALPLFLFLGCTRGQLINPGNLMTPAVLSVVPPLGAYVGGTRISVHGSGFVKGGGVKLGAQMCDDPVWVSSYEIHCTTPAANVGPVDVSVSNPNRKVSTLAKGYVYTEDAGATPGQAVVAGGSVNVTGSTRIAVSTAGEIGGPVMQLGTHRFAVSGIQAVLSSGH